MLHDDTHDRVSRAAGCPSAPGGNTEGIGEPPKLKIATEPTLVQKGELKILGMRDEGFDRAYVDQIGVAVHESATGLFQQAAAQSRQQ